MRYHVRFPLLLFVAIVLIGLSYSFIAYTSETSQFEKVDRLFAEFDKKDSPGAAIAIIRDGKILYSRGYGMANLEYDIPITSSTIFHVASVSKQFTAFAIAMLDDRGYLSLDDDVRDYIPEFPDFGETITIRQLIHHISGLRDQWELLAMAGWRLDDVITKEHILKMLEHQRELNFKPGEEYLYSNMGYTVLAEIVGRVTGQSFQEWTQENIFEPLGMGDTHFHEDHRHIVPNRAYSYSPDPDNDFRHSVLSYANVGATSLFTTVEDLAAWIKNYDSMDVGNERIMSTVHNRGKLNKGERIDYAFALQMQSYRGADVVGHGGADAGFRSYVGRFPAHGFAVVVLSNVSTMSPQRLACSIADIFLADELLPAEARKEIPDRERADIDPEIIDQYIGRYKMQPGVVISLTREDDRLLMQTLGLDKVELIPMDENRFFRDDINLEITFEPGSDGKIYHMTMNQDGNSTPAIRIDGNKPTSEELHRYTGTYYSDELGTFYTIELREDRLVATHRRHSDIELTPIINTRFSGNQWWFRTVEFVEDRRDGVEGFLLSGGRVRNIYFEKQN